MKKGEMFKEIGEMGYWILLRYSALHEWCKISNIHIIIKWLLVSIVDFVCLVFDGFDHNYGLHRKIVTVVSKLNKIYYIKQRPIFNNATNERYITLFLS